MMRAGPSWSVLAACTQASTVYWPVPLSRSAMRSKSLLLVAASAIA
jgi:hypothetical protein